MNPASLSFIRIILTACLASLLPVSVALAAPAQVPLETKIAGAGIDPNVMILLDNSYSMRDKDSTGVRRIRKAKDAVKSIIDNTENARFCLSTFDRAKDDAHHVSIWGGRWRSHGAYINENRVCGAPKAALIAQIDNMYEGNAAPWTYDGPLEPYAYGTPSTSALFDITRYFQNLPPWFGTFDDYANYADPILGSCQQNIVIVATDGHPYHDWHTSEQAPSLPNVTAVAGKYDEFSHNLPRWADGYPGNIDSIAGKRGTTTCRANSNSGNQSNRNEYSACLDDLALYAHQIDLRTGSGWDDPPYAKQSLDIYTIGMSLAGSGAILQSTADFGGGSYKTADSSEGIISALSEIISGVAMVSGTESDISASGTSFFVAPSGIDFYITSYNTDGWFGELYSYNVTESGPGIINSTAGLNWKASENIPSVANRNLFTHNTATGNTVSFERTNLSSAQMIEMGVDPILLDSALNIPQPDPDTGDPVYPYHPDDYDAERAAALALLDRIINYLKGDITNENSQNNGTHEFRDRTRTIEGTTTRNILGDIIHSRPTFIHQSDYGYPDADYATYLDSGAPDTRTEMVYIGANDGILHAIDATNGEEIFGFIPATLMSKMRAQSELNFDENHQIYIDGKSTGLDAKLEGSWATVYASPLGAGGKGLFLLDVTDPTASIGNIYRWEINNTTSGFSDLGYIINQAKITRVLDAGGDEHWVLITGNGVHSDNGAAVIYIINLDDGTLFQPPIVLDSGIENGNPKYGSMSEGNGLMDIAAVSVNGSTYANRLFAATLKGEMWRLDYNPGAGDDGAFENHFESANDSSATPFFTATAPDKFDYDRDGNTSESVSQSITGEITVTQGPSDGNLGALGGHLVSFGTGRYFEDGDIKQENNLKLQSFYTVWDTNKANSAGDFVDGDLDRSDLEPRTIEDQYGVAGNSSTFRDTIGDPIDWSSQRGWYVDLDWDYGERVISRPLALFGQIAFKTIVPTTVIQDVHLKSPIDDNWLANGNGGINEADQCNTDASGVHGWYMQFDRVTGQGPSAAVFSLQGAEGVGISGESTAGSNIFQNPVIVQKSDGTSSYINIDVEGKVTETESGAQFQRSSWRILE